MNSAIATRRPLYRLAMPLTGTLLVGLLCLVVLSSPVSAQTVLDAGEPTPTPAVAQTPPVNTAENERSLLPLGIGIVAIALATYLVWGATFLVVLDKSSSGRSAGR